MPDIKGFYKNVKGKAKVSAEAMAKAFVLIENDQTIDPTLRAYVRLGHAILDIDYHTVRTGVHVAEKSYKAIQVLRKALKDLE